jgi:signal transduction histidine kinase
VVLATIVVGGGLGVLSTWRVYTNDARVAHAYEVQSALASVLTAITDAETGQRGFLITGSDDYLNPYYSGTARIRRALETVEVLTRDDPGQRQHAVELRRPVDAKLAELAETVALRRTAGFDAARRLVATDLGRRTMTEIRDVVRMMDDAEGAALAAARTESRSRARLAVLTDVAVAAIGIGLVTAIVRLLLSRANELETKVQERTVDLESANARLEAFAFSVAHDLRAPLRGMHGLAQALVEDYGDRLDDTGRDFARRLVGEATSMDALIQDLLAYGRLSHVQLAVGLVNLDEVVAAAVHAVRDDAAQAAAAIEVAPHLPTVSGNRSVLIQVFTNLLSNAIKFGGDHPRISIWAEHRNQMAHVWVEDQGIGIAPQHHDRIFGMFERLHGVESYPGTGVGLAIVRKGVERLGGRVGVDSAVGRGSRFWVELPEAA